MAAGIPEGIDPKEWEALTPEQQAVFNKGYGKAAAKFQTSITDLETKERNYLQQITSYETTGKLTSEQLADAKSRLNELETKYLTEEQKLQNKITQTTREWENKYNTANEQANSWKNLHVNTLLENKLLEHAASLDAFKPEQVVGLTRGLVKIEEKPGENGTPPEFIFKMTGKDEKGVEALVDLQTGMKQFLETNGNLVKGKIIPGKHGAEGFITAGGKTITREMLQDPKFAQDPNNWEDIKSALQSGKI